MKYYLHERGKTMITQEQLDYILEQEILILQQVKDLRLYILNMLDDEEN